MLRVPLMAAPYIVGVLACMPGLAAWWTGRRMQRLLDDPALPELLLVRQRRVLLAVATSVAVLLVLGGAHVVWGLPLAVLGLLAGGFPLRRSLQFESGGLAGYLGRSVKSIVAGLGFWVLLMITPLIILRVDGGWWPVTAVLLPLLLFWEHGYVRVWLRLHAAVPLESDELAPRIRAIVERSGIRAPDLYRAGAPETRFVNALALPSIERPSIVIGSALLDLLDPDEVAAIYAHELSHIEQFSPRVLRRLQLVNRLLIVLAVAVPVLARLMVPAGFPVWLPAIWPIVVLLELVRRAKKSQQRETESDLRAAALCGDAETVASALSKLHMHALIPRRLPVKLERDASHPSLARRIKALHEAGPSAAATIGGTTFLPTGRDGSVVVFDDVRAWWFDGVPAGTGEDLESLRMAAASMRSVAWPELVELRVATRGTERSLHAQTRSGERWTVPLEPSHVAAMQSALDRVDVRLDRPPAAPSHVSTHLLAGGVLAAMLLSGQVGILIVPLLLAVVRPSAAATAALGAMAVGQAVLALVGGSMSFGAGYATVGLPLLAVFGALALFVAYRQRHDTTARDGIRLTSIVLGGMVLVVALVVASMMSVVPVRELPDLPAASLLALTLLGLGAGLAMGRTRRLKRTGGVATAGAVLAIVPILMGAVRHAGDDSLDDVTASAVEIARIDLSSASQLRLSPGGSRFIVQRWDSPGPSKAARFSWLVGDADRMRTMSDASEVEFIDDDHVLALSMLEDQVEVRLERVDSAVAVWTAQLPDMWDATLIVSPADRTWAVAGEDARTDSLLVLSGTAASPEVRTHRYPPLDSISAIQYLVFDDGARLIVPAFDFRTSATPLMPLLALAGFPYRTVFREVSAAGLRRIADVGGFPQCGVPEAGLATCVVDIHGRAMILSMDADGRTTRLGRVRSSQLSTNVGPGPRATFVHESAVTVVDLAARRHTTVEIPGDGYIYEARATADRIAILGSLDGVTQLVLFRLE